MLTTAQVLPFCKTKAEAYDFQQQLDRMLSSLFSMASVTDVIEEILPVNKKEKLYNLLHDYKIITTDTAQVKNFLQEIKTTISQMPVITLTLAFPPNQPTVDTLSTWFVVYAKKTVLLDILVDTSLIGGAIVMCNGNYLDFSLKHIFEEKYKQGEIRLQENI